MSPPQSRSRAGMMRGLSGATRAGKAALVFLAVFIVFGESVGALRNERGAGALDNLEASGSATGQGELPGEPLAGDLTGAPEPLGVQEGGSEGLLGELGEGTEGPEGSVEARRLEQPIHPYSEPMSTPQGPAEGSAEGSMQQSRPEAPKKQRGRLHRLRKFGAKAAAPLRKAWRAFRERMRRAGAALSRARAAVARGAARIWARLPKMRRRRVVKRLEVVEPEPTWFPFKKVYELSQADKQFLETLPEECKRYVPQLPPNLREVWRGYPFLCALWTLFDRDGLVSTNKDGMVGLARELSTKLNAAEMLDGARRDLEAVQLKIHEEIATREDAVANARYIVDAACWFTASETIYERANQEERRKLDSLASLSSPQLNPCELLKAVPRLINLASADATLCLSKAVKEKYTRVILKTILGARKAEAARVEGRSVDLEPAPSLSEDLGRLEGREACSMVQLAILYESARNAWMWLETQEGSVSSFPRRSADERLKECKRPGKESESIPQALKKACAEFQSSPQPTSPEDVAPGTLWMWEAFDVRQEKAD